MNSLLWHSTGIPSTFMGLYGYDILKDKPYILRVTTPDSGFLSQIEITMMTAICRISCIQIEILSDNNKKPSQVLLTSPKLYIEGHFNKPEIIKWNVTDYLKLDAESNYWICMRQCDDNPDLCHPIWLISNCIGFSWNISEKIGYNEPAPCIQIELKNIIGDNKFRRHSLNN